jgi:hypothetical protein
MREQPEIDPEEIVTVYTVNEPTQAELIRAELHAEGIAAEVSGDNQAGLTGILRIDILTRARDADRARKFLAQHEHRLQGEADVNG